MDKLQEVRQKMLLDVEDLDGGWVALAKETGYTTAFLQRTLNVKSETRPRLVTLEKIKKGIVVCKEQDGTRISALLA
jgi:hypothetical protein